MSVPAILFEAAAALLNDPRPDAAPDVLDLLAAVGCPAPAAGQARPDRARLFRAAAGFERFFRLESRAAPGLYCFGAEAAQDAVAAEPGLPVLGVAGSGPTLLAAFEGCVGEGIERLSTVATAADLGAAAGDPRGGSEVVADWLAPMMVGAKAVPQWLKARPLDPLLIGGAPVPIPLDLCVRRPPERCALVAPWPLSLGCAAGPTPEAAQRHALLELIERDAVALWWHGGARPRPFPLEAAAPAAALLAQLRGDATGRRGWLLDITTDLGVPAVAAVSFAADGGGFCFGTAARESLAAAGTSALLELAQIELAIEIVETKRAERGDASLNPTDRQHLARYDGIHAERCALVHPTGPARPSADLPPGLPALLAQLARHGQPVLALDLTRPRFQVPVWRLFAPRLCPEPSTLVVPRLAAAIAAHGGGLGLHGGVALM